MAEWQSDRESGAGQGTPEEEGAPPLRRMPPTTHPRLTLPSLPRVSAVPPQRLLPPRTPTSPPLRQRPSNAGAEPAESPSARLPMPPRSQPPGLRASPAQMGKRPAASPASHEVSQPFPTRKPVTLIPGKQGQGKQRPRRPGLLWRARHGMPLRAQVAILACVLTALSLGVVFSGVLRSGLEPPVSQFTTSQPGSAQLTPAPTGGPMLPPGLDTTDINHYITKYGFDPPKNAKPLPKDEQARLAQMLTYAQAATARYDARYQARVEPEMLLWWTHAEDIGARINYSDCANEASPTGQTYFSAIMNCDRPDFWQLGYGNQFGNIWVLKDAFTDMHGNPNDPALVQKVGQAVLDYDRSQNATPLCGGFSCTFPAMTIDQIMADVHWHASDHKETPSNWWASVLSRDPGINSYMMALALTSFSHAQTKNWVGCYYQEPCWQSESDALWQVLAVWKSLGG